MSTAVTDHDVETGKYLDMLAGLLPESGSHGYPDTSAEEARLDRLGSTLVRRLCNRHDCCRREEAARRGDPSLVQIPCRSRNHRRDLQYALTLLQMLGLSGQLAVVDDYEKPAAYHSPMGKREAREWARNR